MPGPFSTNSSIFIQCICIQSTNVDPTACVPTEPVATNNECRRHPKAEILESMDEKYFKGQQQLYVNYAKLTLEGIIQHMYADHGTILPMEIE